ncbi:Glycoside hydrolase, family 45 [Kalmanozyma brasiliensis GHG001]|uniref:Cellulase n=1 Tax=Kalmanozyma brasiliensis (strain GHG001) TaxID=1365824 RepID=V5E9S2_KALBG|nr:Glycoside hydrolase, family 45 [Kalmanozyma brasiliensis GHG001]EST07081.1 Glycoside hydrolase, family 45 [Kalmanozyma brasiliensis GHG001]
MALKLNIGLLAVSLSLALVHLDGASAGMATRYWDCCKPSASWNNKAPVYAPVDTCKADGVTLIDPSQADQGQSGCNGGNQYMCSCMQPFNDESDSTLGLGFAAFSAGSESETDCACYYAEFAHDGQGKPIKRNKLLFQVTNTGGDVQSENIDFQIPGGGLGAFAQGCPAQWSTPASQWGQTYGGVSSASQCSNLPHALQEGCQWRFSQWGDNPVLKGAPKRVRCPKSLIDRSGCQRKDDNTVSPYSGQVDSGNTAAPAQYKRNRSVCLGGKKESYGAPGTGGSHVQPIGYGSGNGGAAEGSNNGAGQGAGDKPAPGANNGAVSPSSNGGGSAPQGYSPTKPSVPKGHKKHRVCQWE